MTSRNDEKRARGFKEYTCPHYKGEGYSYEIIDGTITLCRSCWCATYTIGGRCGKCKEVKPR